MVRLRSSTLQLAGTDGPSDACQQHVRRVLLQQRSWITLARTLLGAMVHGVMKLFLGIDGGQTATKSILADASGRIIGTGRGGPAIHLKDGATREHAQRVLYEAVHQALRQ